jgi:hypothetical protein
MDVGGPITLNGNGTYIFRANGALTSDPGSIVSLSNGASACDVFWTPTAATTLSTTGTFFGTVIDNANAITVGANTSWTGRALSLGAGIVTNGDTVNITVPTCAAPILPSSSANNTLTVIKEVVNDNGATSTYQNFPLFINGNPVVSGESVSLAPGIYKVTETNLPNYKATFAGDCNANGQVNHGGINTHNDLCKLLIAT